LDNRGYLTNRGKSGHHRIRVLGNSQEPFKATESGTENIPP